MEKNVKLAKYSRFCVGGVAEYFYTPTDTEELINFIKNKQYKLPINVIGAGSNLIFKNELIKGTFIYTKNLNNIELNEDYIKVGSGVLNSKLFNFAKSNDISGFEFLGCIPGTVGGSCRMNAGCYNKEIKDILFEIKTIDLNGNIKTYTKEECNFDYRYCGLDENLIILEATFIKPAKGNKEIIENTFKEMLDKKLASQPINEKTCGSTFKNTSDEPAWKIINKIGLQGKNINGVAFSEKHANFLVNYSSDDSQDLIYMIELAKNKAKSELNVDLELEVKIIGNTNENIE